MELVLKSFLITSNIKSLQRISLRYEQKVYEMNSRLKEQENINRELKSEINSAQATLEVQNAKISEKDAIINKKTSLIQYNYQRSNSPN